MTYFLKISGAILIGIFVIGWLITNVSPLSIFFPKYDTYDWRQKTTLVVETPEGELSASSVVNVRAQVSIGPTPVGGGQTGSWIEEGEAVALEVTPGQWLFVTLPDQPAELTFRADESRFPSANKKIFIPYMQQLEGPISLKDCSTPLLVTFEDITDRLTAAIVDPRDLTASFGPGYSLKDITVEIVRDDVTSGQLGPLSDWIMDYRWTQLDGNQNRSASAPHQVANSLSFRDFKRVPK